MDRDRLRQWLRHPPRTWRWRGANAEGYEAVEASERGLQWFRWSHEIEDGGMREVLWQTHDDFLAHGPPRTAPAHVEEELREWLAEHRARNRENGPEGPDEPPPERT